ncbi:hypothetical protein EW146_g475 [Bondarzewia mesenterica]|uniref:Uncharacterized protein n=1 Tax=Bondarzewia mesenterica TaxID=1095465 RepID=A0A4S4M746_9AGAM|nr:hypothetical protein EW146_g475 [Bondarzewia mesenterica]
MPEDFLPSSSLAPKSPLNPPTSSANPASSLPALWGYLEPALDHILRAPTSNLDKPPAIDVTYHMGIHTAVYNYFTSAHPPNLNLSNSLFTPTCLSTPAPRPRQQSESVLLRSDIYKRLDSFFAEVAREHLLCAPLDEIELIHHLIMHFKRFSSGAHAISRLLNYVNRYYVKRAVDEDRGWLGVSDILEELTQTPSEADTREKIAAKLRHRRAQELQKWGYDEGNPPDRLALAEACAEAASGLDRVVPLTSLAHRRFRTEAIEPLLTIPKGRPGPKARKKRQRPPNDGGGPAPKSRLARSVKVLLESSDVEEQEKRQVVEEMAKVLIVVGVRPDHPLRKQLDTFLVPDST